MHVRPSWPPPPMRKLRNGRATSNSGEVSLPCGLSPSMKVLTRPFSLKTAHRLLSGQCSLCRPRAKGLAFHFPIAVIGLLEIRQHDGRARGAARIVWRALPIPRSSSSDRVRMTRFSRTPSENCPLRQQTAFWRHPANSTSAVVVPVFLSLKCRTVAGSAESAALSGMKGRKRLHRHRDRESGSAYSTRPIGYSPRNEHPGKPVAIQGARESLAIRPNPQGKTLLHGLHRRSERPGNASRHENPRRNR